MSYSSRLPLQLDHLEPTSIEIPVTGSTVSAMLNSRSSMHLHAQEHKISEALPQFLVETCLLKPKPAQVLRGKKEH